MARVYDSLGQDINPRSHATVNLEAVRSIAMAGEDAFVLILRKLLDRWDARDRFRFYSGTVPHMLRGRKSIRKRNTIAIGPAPARATHFAGTLLYLRHTYTNKRLRKKGSSKRDKLVSVDHA